MSFLMFFLGFIAGGAAIFLVINLLTEWMVTIERHDG